MNSEKEGRGRGLSHCGKLALTPRRGSSFTIVLLLYQNGVKGKGVG